MPAADDSTDQPLSRWYRRRRLPGNPASAVYGTILAAGQLAVESNSHRGTGQMLGSLGLTLVVFWLAHAYTDSIGLTIQARPGTAGSYTHAMREEWPIVESGLFPAAALGVAVLAGADPATGALWGLVVCAVELVGWATLAARRAELTGLRLLTTSLLGGAVGLLLVALKYLLH
jgi:hypothetical protein